MTPGVSVSNSEVGLACLSIAAFFLRLICTNGMVSATEVRPPVGGFLKAPFMEQQGSRVVQFV
jgi:hypothetical protein